MGAASSLVSSTHSSGVIFIPDVPAGEEVIDHVALDNGLTLWNQSIGAAFFSEGFDGVDGILGYVTLYYPTGRYLLTIKIASVLRISHVVRSLPAAL